MTVVIEQIAPLIVARIERVTEANGYAQDVAWVKRPGRSAAGFTWQDRGVLVVLEDVERNDQLTCEGNPPGVAWDQTVRALCCVKPGKSVEDVGPIAQQLAADVQKAICTPIAPDTTDWAQWGGLALNTRFQTTQEFSTDDGADGLAVTFVITYRVAETDPAIQR